MIRLAFKLPVLLAFATALVWAAVLARGGSPERLLADNLDALAAAYPEAAERKRLLADWGTLPPALSAFVPKLGGRVLPLARAGLLAARLHSGVLLRLLPVFALLLASGVGGGLVSRERMRDGGGYASPTVAGLGHILVGAGLFWLGLFGLSPIPGSYFTLYLAGFVLALGGTLYAANLPLKL